MARKDVDMVIRAKDEAEKVVKSITAAINDFTEAQKDLSSKAGKTENSMQALGAAFGQLQKDLRGGSASDLLAKSLDTANNAVERLEKSVAGTREEVRRLDSDFKASTQGVEQLRQKVAAAAKALDDGQQTLKRYKTDLGLAEKEARALAQAEAALNISGIEKQLQKKAEAADKTQARLAELRAQIEAVEKPTKRLTTSLETNTTKFTKQQAEVSSLTTALDRARAKQAELAQKMGDTAQKIESSNAAIKQQGAVVAGLGADYERMATETKAAEQANIALGKSVEKTNGVLSRQEDQLTKAQVELKQFAATSQQAEAAIKELSGLSIKGLEDDLGRQRRAMLEAKREYVDLASRATELASEMGRVGVPTREMVQDFDRLKIEAGAAKAELGVQRETLERMGRAFRDAGTDMESLTVSQTRFVALQGQAGSSIQAIRSKTEQSVNSLNRLHEGYKNAADSAGRLGPRIRENANAQQRELTVSEQLARAYRNLYGEKRTALSLTQRLRGEVLSLVAAYGGLYGVIDILRRTVDAYQQVEAAQARLNVAFDGDIGRTATEMDFLRRNAERLGVEFGALATEYSKFAIATKNTAIEGEQARKLFLQITEAARVNRSSMEDMKGVFTAVTQIVSKGAVQMEELRQQLGDRLPGAIQLMADGLGVTTAELIKMMEQGQVTASALVPFGNELEKRFGPQLGESLKSTAAEMGRLQNAAFQALTAFGKAGFIDSFTSLLRTLTETLQSADAEAFISRLSVAFGKLLDVIGFVVTNFELVAAAAGAFVGIKLVPFVLAIGTGFTRLKATLIAARTEMVLVGSVAQATGARVGIATTAVRGLSVAFKGLLSSTGVGLALVAISTAIGYWSTQADNATEAMHRHQDILDRVRNAYDLVGNSVDQWREKLDGVTVTQARSSLLELQSLLNQTTAEFENAIPRDIFGNVIDNTALDGFFVKLDELGQRFKRQELTADELRSSVDALFEEYRGKGPFIIDQVADKFDSLTKVIAQQGKDTQTAQDILTALTGTTEEAAAALDRLSGRAAETGDNLSTQAAAGAERFNAAMEALKETLPQASSEMSKLEQETAKIESALQQALIAARALPDAIMRIAAEQQALAAANQGLMDLAQNAVDSNFARFTDATEASAALIRQFEGFRETPYWDVNAFRAGFGSDTVTLADGTIQKITEGMRVSVADANRDLARRIADEFMPIARTAVGADRFGSFTAQQQAALTSIAYNYGEIPDRIVEALRTGTNEDIANAIRGLAGDNGGINRGRRFQEAALFTSQPAVETAARQQEQEAARLAEEARKRAEAAQDYHDTTAANIAQAQFELSIADQDLIKREQAKAIREAELAAQEAGTELTQQEREAILANVEAKYRQQAIDEAAKDAQEERAKAEERINQLLEYRDALKTQLDAATKAGEADKAEELRSKIAEINGQLETAITNAQAMWQAVGGENGDAAIARLEALRIKSAEFGQQAEQAYFSWAKVGDLLLNGLSNAFDTFVQGIAEGKSATEAARDAFLQFAADFLRQIAQMIIKQAIFNALKGTGLGNFLGIGVAHTGGMIGSKRAGSGNTGRKINPAVFAGAMRYHVGGLAGLRPGEVPLIAKQNEEVLTRDDPRHVLNGGKNAAQAGAETLRAKIVNAIDAPSFLEAALNSPEGERVFLNFMKANQNAVSGAGF